MKKREGFTLIELLVVIAIIGLLLAILAPSLNKAKEKGKEIICRSNLRGVGMAITLYLEDYDGRAYDCSRANRHRIYDPSVPGEELIDFKDPGAPEWYWGLAYLEYAEEPSLFGCPSYNKVLELLYPDEDPAYAPYSGYGLNTHFYRDPRLTNTDPFHENRKVTDVKSPFQFIITHDHVEPRHEGTAHGGDQGDQLYMTSSGQPNLAHYRPPGSRAAHYWGIFRHSKKNRGMDEPAEHQIRLNAGSIDKNPNGSCNILFLDGHSEGIKETIGENIRESWYSGI